MRDAYSVSNVRAAEAALFALVPDGARMQRAAAGLASVCAGLLRDSAGGVYGARVVVLAGTGDNGGGGRGPGGGGGAGFRVRGLLFWRGRGTTAGTRCTRGSGWRGGGRP